MPGPAFLMVRSGRSAGRTPWQRRRKGLDAPRGGAWYRGSP